MNTGSATRSASTIDVPEHIQGDRLRVALYKLLVRAYAADGGAEYDDDCGQEMLCDCCGVTACGAYECKCVDVLCPHGRVNAREKGREDERKAVVAWLREQCTALVVAYDVNGQYYAHAADAIEAGEHRGEP